MFPRRRYRVAVLGATGAVGSELLKELDKRRFPTSDVRVLCSPGSAGSEVSFGKRKLICQAAVAEQFADVELVFSAAGDEAAKTWLPVAKAAGAVCIDCSDWTRERPDTARVVPELNPERLAHQDGIIGSPNPSAIAAAIAIAPLQSLGEGIESVVVTTLEPASGAGHLGLAELSSQAVSLLNFAPVDVAVHPARLAFNTIPAVGELADSGHSAYERALESDLAALIDADVLATCVRVPVFVGVGLTLTVRMNGPVEATDVTRVLTGAPGLTVTPSSGGGYPMVMDLAEHEGVHIGRVRVDGDVVRIWAVADNLRTCAASNMIHIAELLDSVWTAAEA
ncbi:MAG: aspartate-semialdehyde dehydrogenase [Myxococcales bacterium]|nr:aspartate-semialdehyde dehydrogenase [Myxococcales bacterium]